MVPPPPPLPASTFPRLTTLVPSAAAREEPAFRRIRAFKVNHAGADHVHAGAVVAQNECPALIGNRRARRKSAARNVVKKNVTYCAAYVIAAGIQVGAVSNCMVPAG